MNRLVIVGATGNIGRQVLARLPDSGIQIRALVRNLRTASLPPHVEAVQGDLNLPESLDACLDGADTVFLIWNAPPAAFAAAFDRIEKQARRIVYLSAPLKTPHPFFQQPNPSRDLNLQIETQIENSGLQWTFLRPGMFAANCLHWWAGRIRAGQDVIRWPYADVPTAPIHERDIASVAVRALCETGHEGAEYVLTGPQSLTQREQLSAIADVIGRPLRMEDISPDEAREELSSMMPMGVLNMLLDAWGAAIGQPAYVTSTVADLTGTPARTFRDWVSDHAIDFRP